MNQYKEEEKPKPPEMPKVLRRNAEVPKSPEVKKALEKALKYLALRPRSRKELEKKLKNKKIDNNIVNSTLEQVDNWGYLNDEEFAKSFLELKKFSGKGKIFIFRELKRKGVDEEIIKKILSQFYTNEEEHEIALSLVKKKFPDFPKLKSRKEIIKLKNYLLQRGFSWETINELF